MINSNNEVKIKDSEQVMKGITQIDQEEPTHWNETICNSEETVKIKTEEFAECSSRNHNSKSVGSIYSRNSVSSILMFSY